MIEEGELSIVDTRVSLFILEDGQLGRGGEGGGSIKLRGRKPDEACAEISDAGRARARWCLCESGVENGGLEFRKYGGRGWRHKYVRRVLFEGDVGRVIVGRTHNRGGVDNIAS